MTNLYYVIWDGKSRTSTLAFAGKPDIEEIPTKKPVHLPLSFSPKESKRLSIVYKFIISKSFTLFIIVFNF